MGRYTGVCRCAGLGLALGVGACADRGLRDLPHEVEFTTPPGSMAPHLAAGLGGALLLVWHEPAGADGYALRVAVRRDGAWSRPATVAEGRPFFVNWADVPSVLELPGGAWVVHWLERVPGSTYAYHVKLAFSTDGGATWGDPIVPHRDTSPTEHGFVSVVGWPDGAAALVWLDGRKMAGELGTGEMTLRFTTARPGGALGDEVTLDERTCECCQTALVRTASGALVAYRDRSADEVRDIALVRYADGRWSAPALVAEDRWRYPGCPVNGPALDADGDAVVVAWYTEGSGAPHVYAAFSSDGGASFAAPIRVDEGDPLGRVDALLEPDGSALVLWMERGDAPGLRIRRVRADGALGHAYRLAALTPARSSGFPRLARADAALFVAWTDVPPGAERSVGVKVARLLRAP